MEEYNMRPLTSEDVTQLGALEVELFTSEAWSQATIWEEITSVYRAYNGLFTGEGQLVAWAGISLPCFKDLPLPPDDQEILADILTVGVAPAHRRRGLAKMLVDQCIQAAKAAWVTTVLLEVRESNTSARSLYKGMGFIEISRRTGYYHRPREDAIVMAKEVRKIAIRPARS